MDFIYPKLNQIQVIKEEDWISTACFDLEVILVLFLVPMVLEEPQIDNFVQFHDVIRRQREFVGWVIGYKNSFNWINV